MAFCPNCGAQAGAVAFCPNCGSAITAASGLGSSASSPSAGASVQPISAPGMGDNVAGALCYLGWFVTAIIFLVLAPYNQSKFVRFHAFQSIFLFVAWLVVSIVFGILHLWLLHLPLELLMLVLWLYLMYSAFNNNKVKLPVIGDLAEKQA